MTDVRSKMTSEDNAKGKIRIIYKPVKEIVILDYFQFSKITLDQMFARLIHAGLPITAQWAEGVVFLYFPLPASTETTAKLLVERGRVYWTFLGYSFMPKYQAVIETKEKMIVPVVDMTSNALIKEVALWLKTQKQA